MASLRKSSAAALWARDAHTALLHPRIGGSLLPMHPPVRRKSAGASVTAVEMETSFKFPKIIGGPSQIVSRIRMKCNGKQNKLTFGLPAAGRVLRPRLEVAIVPVAEDFGLRGSASVLVRARAWARVQPRA